MGSFFLVVYRLRLFVLLDMIEAEGKYLNDDADEDFFPVLGVIIAH